MKQKSDEKLDRDWLKEFPARVDEVFNDETEMTWDEWKKKKAYILSGNEETKHPRFSFLTHLIPHPGLLTVAFAAVTAMLWGMFIIFQLVYETIHPENSHLWYYRVLKPIVTPDNPVSLIVLIAYSVLAVGLIFATLHIEGRVGKRFEIIKGEKNKYESWGWKRRWLYPSFWSLIVLMAVGAYGVLVASLIASYNFANVQEFKENFFLISLVSIAISTFMFYIIPVIPLSVFHVWSLVPLGKTLMRKRLFVWGVFVALFVLSTVVVEIILWNAGGQWKGYENWINRSLVLFVVVGALQFLWYLPFNSAYVSWKNAKRAKEGTQKEKIGDSLDVDKCKKASGWFRRELVRGGALVFVLFLLYVAFPLLVAEQLIPAVQKIWTILSL